MTESAGLRSGSGEVRQARFGGLRQTHPSQATVENIAPFERSKNHVISQHDTEVLTAKVHVILDISATQGRHSHKELYLGSYNCCPSERGYGNLLSHH